MTKQIEKSLSALPEMKKLIFSLFALFVFATTAQAQTNGVAVLTHLSGTLTVKRADGVNKLLGVKSAIFAGDLLATEADTYARLKFVDGGEVVLRPNTQFRVDSYHFDPADARKDGMLMSLLKGGLRAVTGLLGQRSKDKVEYRTTTATIGIRGTNHGMLLCQADCLDIPTVSGQPPADGLYVDVAFGAIEIRNEAGQQRVDVGQFAFAPSSSQAPILIPPGQGVQVTMPQAISANATEGRGLGGPARDTSCTF